MLPAHTRTAHISVGCGKADAQHMGEARKWLWDGTDTLCPFRKEWKGSWAASDHSLSATRKNIPTTAKKSFLHRVLGSLQNSQATYPIRAVISGTWESEAIYTISKYSIHNLKMHLWVNTIFAFKNKQRNKKQKTNPKLAKKISSPQKVQVGFLSRKFVSLHPNLWGLGVSERVL